VVDFSTRSRGGKPTPLKGEKVGDGIRSGRFDGARENTNWLAPTYPFIVRGEPYSLGEFGLKIGGLATTKRNRKKGTRVYLDWRRQNRWPDGRGSK